MTLTSTKYMFENNFTELVLLALFTAIYTLVCISQCDTYKLAQKHFHEYNF